MFTREKLLGIALIAGGALVGIIVMVLMSGYARSGDFSTGAATIGVILGFVLLVLPQMGLGVYLIWHDIQTEKNDSDESI